MKIYNKKIRKIQFFLMVVFLLIAVSVIAQEETFIYNDNGRRDPFWSLVSPNGILINYETDLFIDDLILEGVMIGADGNNLAIINGQVLKVADTFGQFFIVKIAESFVTLREGAKTFDLKLKKGE